LWSLRRSRTRRFRPSDGGREGPAQSGLAALPRLLPASVRRTTIPGRPPGGSREDGGQALHWSRKRKHRSTTALEQGELSATEGPQRIPFRANTSYFYIVFFLVDDVFLLALGSGGQRHGFIPTLMRAQMVRMVSATPQRPRARGPFACRVWPACRSTGPGSIFWQAGPRASDVLPCSLRALTSGETVKKGVLERRTPMRFLKTRIKTCTSYGESLEHIHA